MTINLSARGSINLPKSVIRLYLRAILPSSISVSDAAMKIRAPRAGPQMSKPGNSVSGSIMTMMNTGTRQILKTDNLLGKFIMSFLSLFLGYGNAE